MNPFNRILNPVTFEDYNGKRYPVFVRVEWNGKALSLSGVEGPTSNGNCRGSCGQIRITPNNTYQPSEGWTAESVARLWELWDRWHLNDMRAGSPAQETWLRANPVTAVYPESHYEKASAALEAAGLNPDPESGYKYGHAWIKEAIPESVLAELQAFPESTIVPAWV